MMPETLSLPVRLSVLCVGLTLWVMQYFIINNLTRPARPRANLGIALDEWIPFIPEFIIVYLSTYIFGLLPFVLIADTGVFISTTLGYAIIILVSSALHVAYPSQIRRRESAGGQGLSWRLITWFQSVCKPYGNFPSTHVAFAVMSVNAGFNVGGPVLGGIFLAWACMIAWSTLATKQHYLLDIVAGIALGTGASVLMALTP